MKGNNSLTDRVGAVLARHDLKAEARWHQHFQGQGNGQTERRQINEYLRLQLGMLPVDTTPQRECLSEDSTDEDYLRLFDTYVAPMIVRHGLPDWNRH